MAFLLDPRFQLRTFGGASVICAVSEFEQPTFAADAFQGGAGDGGAAKSKRQQKEAKGMGAPKEKPVRAA